MTINFWNGNRSSIRQNYELDVLEKVIQSTTNEYGKAKIQTSNVDYLGHEESVALAENHDLLVTVAGNEKFKNQKQLVVGFPIAKNLLGYRIPIIKKERASEFKNLNKEKLKRLVHGIPATWSDASILRHNHFRVYEKGDFNELFHRLVNNEFDYTTFGANEVESVYKNRVHANQNLIIEPHLLLYYPFPLVFYVHPKREDLAIRIEKGLHLIKENGELNQLFDEFFSKQIYQLKLKERKLIQLENPLISNEFSAIQPKLIQ